MKVVCYHCDNSLEIDEAHLKRGTNCPICDGQIQAEMVEARASAAAELAAEREAKRLKRLRQQEEEERRQAAETSVEGKLEALGLPEPIEALREPDIPRVLHTAGGGDNYSGDSTFHERPYEGARTMADFLRRVAKVMESIAKGLAVVCLVLGVVIGLGGPRGSGLVGAMMIIPAVLIWLWAKPFAIIYRGLGDLTDAHLDLVVKNCDSAEQ